ncbi:hypothetical protein N9B28_02775, partial [bacterium]|nr:hypothetical protein [bacterium]
KTLRPGLGVGNNYWDLIPFGGQDAIATMYLYDALRKLTKLEDAINRHPDWKLPRELVTFQPGPLNKLANEIRADFQNRFWNPRAGRFVGWIDHSGTSYDYGFTFVNLEAIHYGLASEEQARSIFDWLDGKRTIAGDTSSGADIYRWRFGPRATTKRNVECYVWAWSGPESIPWGNQVQDGGAVLGFTFHDLMARLKTKGPDDAWKRLEEILKWFDEVQKEGGYRAYYAKPGRGTLQGGGPPGGLGIDREFMESVLVSQVILYGFLGLKFLISTLIPKVCLADEDPLPRSLLSPRSKSGVTSRSGTLSAIQVVMKVWSASPSVSRLTGTKRPPLSRSQA